MTAPKVIKDTAGMIAGMTPNLRPEAYHFCHLAQPDAKVIKAALATFQEAEGLSVIVNQDVAAAAGLPTDQPMRCITLAVYSALDGVGLTAAVATVLADSNIACNMVAAYHHDHAFVPAQDAERAVKLLVALSEAPK